MRATQPLFCLLLCLPSLLAAGCGAHASGNKPAWVDRGANMEHPDFIYVIGRCRAKPSADEARRCAIADAHEQLRSVVGVSGGLVQDEYSESRMGFVDRGNGTQVLSQLNDYWVLVALPRKRMVAPER
jgi:hypothetical protein